jgi:CheY-like chemotaxis protein
MNEVLTDMLKDNPVNMMLLATYMKKNGWEYEKATNGLIAMQAFQNRPEGFDVIFMGKLSHFSPASSPLIATDVSMPIMTGYESTRAIRSIELERRTAYIQQQESCSESPLTSPLVTTASLSTSFPFAAPPTPPIRHKPSFFMQTNSLDLQLSTLQLKLNRPALIIALTGFSSKQDQETAFESGVDIFMTKPVRFREVGRILEGWMRSRESEAMGGAARES